MPLQAQQEAVIFRFNALDDLRRADSADPKPRGGNVHSLMVNAVGQQLFAAQQFPELCPWDQAGRVTGIAAAFLVPVIFGGS